MGLDTTRPEPSEAQQIHDAMLTICFHWPDEECPKEWETVRQAISHPAPAVPDAVRRLPDRMRKAAVDIRVNAGNYSNLTNEDAVRIAAAEYWASVLDEAIAATLGNKNEVHRPDPTA